jgi:hypothetical protein
MRRGVRTRKLPRLVDEQAHPVLVEGPARRGRERVVATSLANFALRTRRSKVIARIQRASGTRPESSANPMSAASFRRVRPTTSGSVPRNRAQARAWTRQPRWNPFLGSDDRGWRRSWPAAIEPPDRVAAEYPGSSPRVGVDRRGVRSLSTSAVTTKLAEHRLLERRHLLEWVID